jgi:hypothetical protein
LGSRKLHLAQRLCIQLERMILFNYTSLMRD